MRLINTSWIPSPHLRRLIAFVMPSGVTRTLIQCTNRTGWSSYGGHAQPGCNRVLLRFNTLVRFPFRLRPYQYGQHKGKCVWLGSLDELVVYLAAHELRHVWQHKVPRGWRCWGSRGRYSEIDTEAYAKRMLRKFRREWPTEKKT